MTSPSSPDLRNRLAPLEMDSGEFRRLGHMLVDQLADAMAGVALGKVTPDETTSEVRLAFGLGQTLPYSPQDGPLDPPSRRVHPLSEAKFHNSILPGATWPCVTPGE